MDYEKIKAELKNNILHNYRYLDELSNILVFSRNQLEGCKKIDVLRRQLEEEKQKKKACLMAKCAVEKKWELVKQKVENISEEITGLRTLERDADKRLEDKKKQLLSVWKSLLIATDFYKSRLHCHINFVDKVLIWSFTKISSDENKKFLVKLASKDEKWTCVDMIPKLKSRDTLIETLNETNDIQGFLSSIRRRFKKSVNMMN